MWALDKLTHNYINNMKLSLYDKAVELKCAVELLARVEREKQEARNARERASVAYDKATQRFYEVDAAYDTAYASAPRRRSPRPANHKEDDTE